jgi:hypothetical protein
MPYVSVLARQIEQLLKAKQWLPCEANRFTITAVEPALDPIHHTWLAGRAIDIDANTVMQARPSRIIVEDLTTAAEIERLRSIRPGGQATTVTTMTSFVDQLWDARTAARRALQDAEVIELSYEKVAPASNADLRHVAQVLSIRGEQLSDFRLFETALTSPGSMLAVLADAGLGKTELLRWHEWRHASQYEAAHARRSPKLPPIALRVPLRGLRAFSLDAVARLLAQGDEETRLPALNGEVLAQLVRLDRLVLLLDGLDELDVTREALEDGLRAFRDVAAQGGRVLFATRLGHFSSVTSVRGKLGDDEIAQLEPMSREAGHELLVNYGASHQQADEVLRSLSGPAQGIPLFLLMAYDVGLTSALEPSISESRTRTLLELLTLFCKREEKRLEAVASDVQMDLLTNLAHWANLQGDLGATDALERLGLDATDREARVIANPHALLTRKPNNVIEFKYPQFKSIFTAKALADDWHGMGFRSIIDDFRSVKLEEETVEYLARLIDEARLREAWQDAADSPELRRLPLVRRNLLAVALAKLDDLAQAEDAAIRSTVLRRILGSTDLTAVHLTGLKIERIDLRDWTLHALHGRGGALLYCPNLTLAATDETLDTLDSLDGCETEKSASSEAIVRQGCARLQTMLGPWRRKGTNGLQATMRVATTPDADGWLEARRLGLVTEDRGPKGAKFWNLTDEGKRLLQAFVSADGAESAVADLIEKESTLTNLVRKLGKT